METKILVGDCLERLKDLPDESVHCVVTSPPYWGLRSYQGDPGMIGLEPSFEEHLENLVAVFREVRRVLRQDGTLWLNYGDAYAGGGRGNYGDGQKQKTNAGSLIPPVERMPTGFQGNNRGAGSVPEHQKGWMAGGLKPKDLMMMPARVAMALQADGWWLRSEIIWHKPNPMPESCQDRPTSSHEKIFLLSKSAKYFYDNEAVRTPTNDKSKTPDGWDTGKGSHGKIHKLGRTPKDLDGRSSRLGREPGWRENREPVTGANLRNVWKIATHSFSEAHFATFPPKLVEPCVLAGTSEKGVCAECGAPWVRVGVGRKPDVVSKALLRCRERLDLSVSELAELVGVGANNIWDWEVGGHVPTGPRWDRLSSALELGITREDFLERAEYIVTGSQNGPKRRASGELENMPYSERKLRIRPTEARWAPTCEHDADPVPATVLDPFAGAGTVGLVAQRLGRSSVLIEISKEYAMMAGDRITQDMPLFSRVEMVEGAGIEPATSCVQNRCTSN